MFFSLLFSIFFVSSMGIVGKMFLSQRQKQKKLFQLNEEYKILTEEAEEMISEWDEHIKKKITVRWCNENAIIYKLYHYWQPNYGVVGLLNMRTHFCDKYSFEQIRCFFNEINNQAVGHLFSSIDLCLLFLSYKENKVYICTNITYEVDCFVQGIYQSASKERIVGEKRFYIFHIQRPYQLECRMKMGPKFFIVSLYVKEQWVK